MGLFWKKGLWSVAEEALLPRSRVGSGRSQWSEGGVRLRRLCLSR